MKKNRAILMMAVFFVFVTVMVFYNGAIAEDCGAKCTRKCEGLGSGSKWAKCMEKCMKNCLDTDPINIPQPVPDKPVERRSDLNNFKSNVYANAEKDQSRPTIMLASASDDKDQPCYVDGKKVDSCSRKKPYYNELNGQCYSTFRKCITADGDFFRPPGMDFCVRCGK